MAAFVPKMIKCDEMLELTNIPLFSECSGLSGYNVKMGVYSHNDKIRFVSSLSMQLLVK